MDATVPAVVVPGSHCVELVQRQLRLAGDAKAGVRRAMPQCSDPTAQGAIALHDVVELRIELERDPAAMTRALVGQSFVHERSEIRRAVTYQPEAWPPCADE